MTLTRYEITATRDDISYLVGYCGGSPSRPQLLRTIRNHGEAVVSVLGIGDEDILTWHTKPSTHALVAGWRIGYTGRTQRDAHHSELPWIEDVRRDMVDATSICSWTAACPSRVIESAPREEDH